MRTMTWIIRAVTMATRIAAATTGSGNRPSAKIFQFRNLPQECGALSFQGEKQLHDG
jgi:hypothetical protein